MVAAEKMDFPDRELKTPPKPLTVEEILSDLATFEIPIAALPPTRRLLASKGEGEWWKLFEAFRDDIELRKTLQIRLANTGDQLTQRRDELYDLIEKLELEMKVQEKTIEKNYPAS